MTGDPRSPADGDPRSRVTADPRLIRALLACYPAGWRVRYGDEYAQLLCDLRIGHRPALILDSLRGAVRAHGGVFMSARTPMITVVWATALFTVAGLGFQKLAEDFTGVATGTYVLVIVAAAVALAGLVLAAAPAAVALLRRRDSRVWRYVTVPVAGVVVWFAVLRLALALGAHGVHSALTVTGFVLVVGTGIAVVAVTAWAAATVLGRVPAPPRRPALVVVAGGMALSTLAALIWGLRLHAADPGGFRGDHGLLATPFVPNWIVAVALMAVATGLAARAGSAESAHA